MSGIIRRMEFGIATHQARSYQISTPVYEGPLDLLLQLIERAELDITKLSLALVTDQYLEHLKSIQTRSAEEVSAFLIIAAKLLQIKSEALLPRPPVREEGEEDPGESLAQQLRLYKHFKEIAKFLGEREASNARTYLRMAPSPKVEGILDMNGLGVEELIEAARNLLSKNDDRPELNTVVAAPKVTIREKISLIAQQLRRNGRTTFRSLLKAKPAKIDVVVTFLAMLELVKRRLITAQQEGLFGEIDIEPVDLWEEDENFELEFGE